MEKQSDLIRTLYQRYLEAAESVVTAQYAEAEKRGDVQRDSNKYVMLRVRAVGLIVVWAWVFLAVAGSCEAATYYVAASGGSDSNSCRLALSTSTPKATIQAGVDCVRAAGDMVIVRDGTYTSTGTTCGETTIVCVTTGGSVDDWVTVMAENPCTFRSGLLPVCGTVLDGNNARNYGFVMWGDVSFVHIEGFEIRAVANDAIILNNMGSGFEVVGNYIHNTGQVCSDSRFGKAGVYTSRERTTITQNVMHSIGRLANGESGCPFTIVNLDHGIYASGVSSLLVMNNSFHDFVKGWAIQLYPTAMWNVRIMNNTFALPHPSREGHILVGASLTNCDIANNVSYSPTTAFLQHFGPVAHSDCTVRNNVVYGADLWTSVPEGVTNIGNEVSR